MSGRNRLQDVCRPMDEMEAEASFRYIGYGMQLSDLDE